MICVLYELYPKGQRLSFVASPMVKNPGFPLHIIVTGNVSFRGGNQRVCELIRILSRDYGTAKT